MSALHLVTLAVAELGRGPRRLAERAVERRGHLRRIAHDRHAREAGRVERLADRGHAAVHHVGRGDQIRAGARLDHCDLAEQVGGRVVVHLAVDDDATVPVVGVLAEADVAADEQIGGGALDGADRLLHDALLVVRLGSRAVLRRRQAEQDHAPQAQLPGALGVLDQLVHRSLEHAGEQLDLAPYALAVGDEQRPHQLGRDEVGLLHQAAQCGGAAQPAHAADRELAHRASKLAAPCACSKRATFNPAAAGSAGSIALDAVS